MELNFSEPPESGFFLRCFLSVCFLVQYVLFQSGPYALFPQGCSNVKKFPTRPIMHTMFQSVQSLPEWLETKFIFFSILALVYNPAYLLPERKPSPRERNFPIAPFREPHARNILPRSCGCLCYLESHIKMNSLGKNLLLCCGTVPNICRATEFH